MMKFILSLIIALLLTLPSFSAFAAGMDASAGKWWRHQKVAQRLNLSQEEINQLDSAFVDSRKKLIELKGHVEIEQLELEMLIENPTLDEPAVLNQYQNLEKARMALGTERFRFFMLVRKIIGYEKFQQLMVMKKNRDN
jgi:Spy/CpxP family protein refolding chaperone